jgi:hypothetical protein
MSGADYKACSGRRNRLSAGSRPGSIERGVAKYLLRPLSGWTPARAGFVIAKYLTGTHSHVARLSNKFLAKSFSMALSVTFRDGDFGCEATISAHGNVLVSPREVVHRCDGCSVHSGAVAHH